MGTERRARDSASVIARSDTLLARGSSETLASVSDAATAPRAHDSLAPGDQVGRYVIDKRLAAGGMGIVYLADDPELKRKVVLKLLRPELVGRGSDSARMLREAQAMAQVSHANVVPVYDVGLHDEQVFLAMEYIAGVDLAAWLQRAHSQRAILDVFVAAGRGLAAAHRAGLVHRDFKPQNVLIGERGEVKVTDFGVARAELAPAAPGGATPLLESSLTQTGALVGTPAYMAPEQILCGEVDARTDQFSFCVALYEALYRERPFTGHTAAELFDSTVEGKLPDAFATKRGVPRPVREAIRRGLQVEPARRHASMDALVARIAPRSRRPVALAALAACAIVTAGGVSAYAVRSPEATCSIDAPPPGLWPAARRRTIARGIGESVAARVDSWLASWSAAAAEVCADARSDAAVRTRRRRCLQDAATRMDAALEHLSRGATAMQAHLALEDLVQPEECSTPLMEHALDPTPQQVVLMQPLRAKLLAGGSPDRTVVARWLADARAIGYVPFVAEIAAQLAALEAKSPTPQDAAQTLRATAVLAERAGDDLSWISTNIALLGYLHNATAQEVDAIGDAVRARIARVGGHRELDGTLDMYLGFAFQPQQRTSEALEAFERARAAFHLTYGATSMREASLLFVISSCYSVRDGLASPDAAKTWARSAAMYQRLGIPEPPTVSFESDPKRLVAQLEQMLAAVAAESPGSLTVAIYENAFGGALLRAGDLSGALAHSQRAIEIMDRLGLRERTLTSALVHVADVATRRHRPKDALAPARRAVEIAEARRDDRTLVGALTIQGRALLEAGEDGAALAALERADTRAAGLRETARARSDRRFLLARAMWRSDRAHARELAHAARSDVETAVAAAKPDSPERASHLAGLAIIDRWLAAHR
jgi:eukaryotic-like serine/threonine-protein kinase